MVSDKKKLDSRAVTLSVVFGTLITLYFNPEVADPFNAPKMYVLMLFSSWLLGFLLINIKRIVKEIPFLFYLNISYLVTLLILSWSSDLKIYAFFGEAQRQLGFFTYFGFSIFMITFSIFFNYAYMSRMMVATAVLGATYIAYGIMQFTGNDFVNWVNQYNPIIGTLGNPNFAAAFMAILGVLSFSFAFNTDHKPLIRVIFAIIFVGLFVVINLSEARQGLLSILLGTAVFLTFKLYSWNRVLGLLGVIFNLLLGIIAIAGMLQFGPLRSLLYKESVTLRGYYWDAGLNMLKEHPITGIGIERYGAYFKVFRDPTYPLKYGYELNSTNAHNVFIQHFATGGLFLGTIFLLINFYILYRAIKGIQLLSGNKRITLVGFLSAWIAYLAQSIVSIDNIGLTLWGWIFGGIIIALSKPPENSESNPISYKINSRQKVTFLGTWQIILSGVILTFSILLVTKLSSAENKVMQIRNMVSSPQGVELPVFNSLAEALIKDNFAQPFYKLELSDYLIRTGQKDKGIELLKDLTEQDPANPNYFFALSFVYESDREFAKAIEVRNQLLQVDPYNVKNFLQLARLYKELGDKQLALDMKERILNFAPDSEEAKLAKIEIQF
jgi:O-antigen ligase